MQRKIILLANTDWYLWNFRLSLIEAAAEAGFVPVLLSPSGPYGARLREAGFDWRPVPMQRRSLNPLRELGLVWHLARLIRRERAVLVHGFTLKCAVYGGLAARLAGWLLPSRAHPARVAAVTGMGYVFTSGDALARVLRLPLRALLRAALAGRGSRLVVQNQDDWEWFAGSKLVDPSAIRLIPGSGVDSSLFAPALRAAETFEQAPSTGTAQPLRVVFVGRLLIDKGVREFVAAAAKLAGREGGSLKFLIAGEADPGNPASIGAAEIDGWAQRSWPEALGQVDDMLELLQSVDIVVLPSYREGLPLSLLEAAACGLAIVATDVPGCRAVVDDGVNGLLVPVRDAAALAAAIERLAADPELRQRLGAAARAKAVRLFDAAIVNAATIDVYRELLPDDLTSAGASKP